jgi:hypothetical protein
MIEAGKEVESDILGRLPRGDQLVERPSPLPGLHPDAHFAMPTFYTRRGSFRNGSLGSSSKERSTVHVDQLPCDVGASSDARNQTAPATSSDSPARPSRVRPTSLARRSSVEQHEHIADVKW